MDRVRSKLIEMMDLEDGWLDGAGLRPAVFVISRVWDTLYQIGEQHHHERFVDDAHIYHHPEGGLSVEWTISNHAIDVTFYRDGKVTVGMTSVNKGDVHDVEDAYDADTIPFVIAQRLVQGFLMKAWIRTNLFAKSN